MPLSAFFPKSDIWIQVVDLKYTTVHNTSVVTNTVSSLLSFEFWRFKLTYLRVAKVEEHYFDLCTASTSVQVTDLYNSTKTKLEFSTVYLSPSGGFQLNASSPIYVRYLFCPKRSRVHAEVACSFLLTLF